MDTYLFSTQFYSISIELFERMVRCQHRQSFPTTISMAGFRRYQKPLLIWLEPVGPPTWARNRLFPRAPRQHLADYISYDQTDFLRAPHHIVLCCPANLEKTSAALRYIFRESDIDTKFLLRPEVGNVLTLPQSQINGTPPTHHFLITR